jgi:hypothetical protein
MAAEVADVATRTDYAWASDDTWPRAWDALIDAVGRDFEPDVVHVAADRIDLSSIRR